MLRSSFILAALAGAASFVCLAPARAQTVMQQCGQQYQAAKAAGTLNGMTWNQFRTDCAARMKATPASTGDSPAATPPPAANPLKPATAAVTPAPAPTSAPVPAPTQPNVATAPAKLPATGGRAAMLTRERQCGSEWRAQKVSLVAQTPGLTWPKYWSQCNARLKAAGQ